MSQKIKIRLVNDKLPKGFNNFWDTFNKEAYDKYLEEKEKWRIEKMKKEN